MTHSLGDYQRAAVLREVLEWYGDCDGHGHNEVFQPQWFLRKLQAELKKAEGK